ncbi:TOG array regulator of axonemal microtubules protein 1 isoform X1 [Molothrus ater]|uniref:TOG array regulator of axonemal microtubules protein 1 isoform X1 n=1 Tax=Molothrus ater TaxID=84834 RepID=UPI0023E81DAE|nr:TOG array regulator of axonemal microtubules protein 1 isoform X1 [Molothrus ater]
MVEPPPGAAAPRGCGRAWERGGSAQHREDGTEPSGPAHNGPDTEPSGPAHNGSDTDPPGPALNGPGTDAPGPIQDGSDTEPPGPGEDGPGTEPPSHAHNGSGTEAPSSVEDGPGAEPPGPQEDAAALLGPELPLVPPELRARLLDRRDYRGRAQAVEQLRRAVEGCSPAALGAAPAAALLGLIALLDALLHDPNFAVARGALEVTRLLALRLGRRVPAVLAPLVCAAARALGDAQPAMRRDSARLLLRLMAAAGPRPVLRLLLQERLLRHRSARLREELLHTCIAALLAFPAAELDLPQLAAALAPALLDAKRRVRHAAMEAIAALASALGPGNAGALLRALDAVELRAGGAGVALAVRARLARNVLPRLGQQGLVEYGVPLPCSGRCRGPCPPPGADTEWLLMGSRSRSAHGHCGHPACRDALHGPACAQRGLSPRRVLSAGRGKNKLPWENEPAADGEGGSGVRMPVAKGVEQLAAANDSLHSPKPRPSQGIPGSAELLFSRSRTSRTSLTSEHLALAAAALGSHQPQLSGKCGTLGYSRGKSGSVGSDLQFLGLNNCQQDKVCSSLSFSSKTQRSFCTQAEPTMSFQGPSASQGTFILPSFPLSSPRNSPKHLSAPAALAGKSQEDPRSLSSSWPLKSFQGLPKPGCQKQLLSQKPGDNTGDSPLEKPSLQLEKPALQLEKHSLQLEKPSLQLEKHSLQLEKPSLQLEKHSLQLEKHSLQLEKPALQLEKPALQLEKHSLQLEKPALQLEKPPLQLEKPSLQLEKPPLQLEKPALQLEKPSLQLEKPALQLEKHSLQLEKPALQLEKHSLQLEKHSLQLEKPALQLEKPSLQLEKPALQLEKHSLQLEKPALQLEKHSLQLEKPALQLEKPALQLEKHSLQLEKHSLQLEKPALQLEKHSLQLEKPPLQLRSALGRGQALRGARPVPPIPRLPSPREPPGSREGTELAAGLAELHLQPEQVDQEEMQNSLRSLRSSAAKKRARLSSSMAELESPDSAVKLEFPGDCPSLGSSPGTTSTGESGISSLESLGSPVATLPRRRRVMSDTVPALGSKSHLAEASPARPRAPEGAEPPPSTGPAESVPGFAPKDDLGFTSGAVAVVGKGVFGSPPGPDASLPMPCVASGDAQGAREGAEAAPGRSFQQNSPSHSCCHAGKEGEIKMTLSKSAQEKLRRRRKEDKEHNHKEQQEGKDLEGKEEFPWERIRLSMSEPEKLAAERFSLCGDLLTSPKNGSLSLENVALNPSLKRTSSLKRSKCSSLLDSEEPCAGRGRCREPPVTQSPEVLDPAELLPFPRPEPALAEALALLADHDWEKKIEGLNFVRCLSAYHAPILTAKLHETTLAVAQEVKNLRSGVSRAAVVCLGDLFTHLKKSMDQELDNAVKVLLHKAGESNTFIREEVDKALKAMVNNVTPARALCSLINGGQSHLHSAVRRCTAQHLGDIVERLGPERVLAGGRPVAERLLPAMARFVQDSSQQTRYYGRRMLFSMMAHPDLDKILEKFVPPKDLPYVKETVGSLREKGLGEMPLDTPSAKGRRSQTGNVGHLRSSSTCRDAPIVPDRDSTESQEAPRRAAPRSALQGEEYLRDLVGSLNARDFRERIRGARQLLLDTESSPGLVLPNIVRIFDAFKPRLHDSNSKVTQVALEAMHKMIPLLKDNLSPVINMLIPAIVDNNLNSKNPGIYAAATNVIQALCQHLDTSLLLQPFCTKAQFLSGKAKQDLTEKLAELVPELYPRKPCAVEQKVLPVLWHLLGSSAGGGSVPGPRTATAALAQALWAQMGPGLLAHAAAQPPHIRKNLEELLETGT